MEVVPLQQAEEAIEAGAGPLVAFPLERAPRLRQGDAGYGVLIEPDGADCVEPPEPHREGRKREAGRFGNRVGSSRPPWDECEENRAVDRVLPRDQEPLGCPRIHAGSKERGAPTISAAFEESLVHESFHVVPERREGLEQQAGRGPQVQARVRGGGEQDLEPAGV